MGKAFHSAWQEVPTPSFVIHEELLRKNLEILRSLQEQTGVHILLAQKCFSMYSFYPLIGEYLSGSTSSGIFEAKLAAEEMQGENHVFSPAYRAEEMEELVQICDHISFNSFAQWRTYGKLARAHGVSCGIRINPEHSTQDHEIYDPCSPSSRLGVRRKDFEEDALDGIEGLHFHTLCEQGAEPLAETLEAVEEKFGAFLPKMKWLNFGGGHHITKADYNLALLKDCICRMQQKYGLTIYLEPGEAVALDAGYLVSTVLDLQNAGADGVRNAILDTSAACHMPDVIEMPYRPPVVGSGGIGEKAFAYRFGGPTCLAGDTIGEYSFEEELKVGDRIVFGDMAIYTMVKTNTFNGMPLPKIISVDAMGKWKIVREFGYQEFKSRL